MEFVLGLFKVIIGLIYIAYDFVTSFIGDHYVGIVTIIAYLCVSELIKNAQRTNEHLLDVKNHMYEVRCKLERIENRLDEIETNTKKETIREYYETL